MSIENKNWSLESWKNFPANQQPKWADPKKHDQILKDIRKAPPLVFAGEIRLLKAEIARAQKGEAFLLQGGDCAEEFKECTAPTIRETLKVLLQMAVILTYAGEKEVIKVGRMAGQYAKPRSKDTELVDGVELPSFRGDSVNRNEPNLEARTPNSDNLQEAYYKSASTLNILRAFTRGGFASLKRVHEWNKEFVKSSNQSKQYEDLADQIDHALTFMKSIGLHPENVPQLRETQFFTSHEALLLDYEQSLTRVDSLTGDWYNCSAHMLWIGDRTRQLDGAHIEFFSGVHNPIGMKVGPNHDIDEVKRIIQKLNPNNDFGRMTLITRFGADKIGDYLPTLTKEISKEGFNVLWSCDPMHGNTFTTQTKRKTRAFDAILKEITNFFEIHWSEGTVPGGIHCELTGKNVTECTGGAQAIDEDGLEQSYETSCDPRLNAEQSIELAFLVANKLRARSKNK